MPRTITYDRHGFILNGKRTFLLNGTIPYYRLHTADWGLHLDLLRASGYTGVDIYVPWNYHELTPGHFDFTSGNRNLATFIDAIHARGLYTYLRPGPYICNEWNCGGLPQWLQRVDGLRIRENEPLFLKYALRYLNEICDIVRERQYTRGGPVILFAVENEYDFYPTATNRHAYISRMRDTVRAAGIDVPLTACVGGGAAIRSATGFANEVIPTPNYYVSGMAEQKVEDMRRHLLAQRFADGAPMCDLPVFVTEMHRTELDQLRVTAGGVKGLGPFNFSGGSHVGFWNGLTNWGGVTPISSAVDFGGMVGFDGTVRKNFWDTRRVTGLLHAFEPEILQCESVHSLIADAPRVDNPNLGALHYDTQQRRTYSLINADHGFVFLSNETKDAQNVRVTPYNQPAFPRRAPLAVPAGAIRVTPFGVPLERWKLPGELRYATAQVMAFSATRDGAELVVYGDDNETVELLLSAAWQSSTSATNASIETESDGTLVLLKATRETGDITLTCGAKKLRILWMTRAAAETWGLKQIANLLRQRGIDKTIHDNWSRTPLAMPPAPAKGKTCPMSQLTSLERQDVDRGAAWYRCTVATPTLLPRAALVLERALDLVSVYWDGQHVGTQWGVGDPLTFILPDGVDEGRHLLDIRTEIWGHSNFHDTGHYATRLDAERGILGKVTLNNLELSGEWRLQPEPENTPPAVSKRKPANDFNIPAGDAVCFSRELACDYPLGAVLTLDATQTHGEIWIDDWMVGRFVLGLLTPRDKGGKVFLTGGPGNSFFLPGALARKGATLRITARANLPAAKLDRITLSAIEPLVGQAGIEPAT